MPKYNVSDADFWLVIGAHQAGATERECSELSGLTKSVIHSIIRHFKMGVVSSMSDVPSLVKRDKDPDVKKIKKRGRPRKTLAERSVVEKLAHGLLLGSTSTESKIQKEARSIEADECLPITPRSLNDSEEEEENSAEDCSGPWEPQDDEIVLQHVLDFAVPAQLWRDAEVLLLKRHQSRMCQDRWQFLKRSMLRYMAQGS